MERLHYKRPYYSFNFMFDYGADYKGILQVCVIGTDGLCSSSDLKDKSVYVESLNATDFLELRPGKYVHCILHKVYCVLYLLCSIHIVL